MKNKILKCIQTIVIILLYIVYILQLFLLLYFLFENQISKYYSKIWYVLSLVFLLLLEVNLLISILRKTKNRTLFPILCKIILAILIITIAFNNKEVFYYISIALFFGNTFVLFLRAVIRQKIDKVSDSWHFFFYTQKILKYNHILILTYLSE